MCRTATIGDKRKYLELDIEPFTSEEMCKTASLYLKLCSIKSDNKCTSCPFPCCVIDLPIRYKQRIGQAKTIDDLFNVLKCCM
jgi:hypothetical protein